LDYTFIIENVKLTLEDFKMKTFIKIFTYAALASSAFLACDNTNINADVAAKPSTQTDCPSGVYDEAGFCKYRDGDLPPYNPYVVIIGQDVKEWMEDQLAEGKSDRRDVYVSDMQRPTRATPEPTVQCSSGGGCIVNGKAMSLEEYNEYRDKFERENPLIYRELDIPGEIIYGYRALMTASEIEELAQRYTEIAIDFYREPQNDDMPVPMNE
jgi:hypothetical protein